MESEERKCAIGQAKNRLIHEKSPYLLQHACNPVDWYPWGDEAFARAEAEDKPVFLSIGYSTCHWCHVMAHESFEDEEVARLLNESFVCIKVDREERPDIDQVYMRACQAMTGRGGWPMTIIMTPDRRPFYAASYVPKESRFGMIGLLDLLPMMRDLWETRRDEVLESTGKIVEALRESCISPEGALDDGILADACTLFDYEFDEANGGFGPAPKFPSAPVLLFLLRMWKRTSDDGLLHMVRHTIEGIRRGGIFDQVGFGIHRYATDESWRIPHFEKMLADQALLALAATEAFQATGGALFRRTAQDVLTYVLRDLRSPDGAFFSAEDADSEGEEGLFYLWTASELEAVLGKENIAFTADVFNVIKGGNFTDESSRMRTGRNILYFDEPEETLAARYGMNMPAFRARLEYIRQTLFSQRSMRVRPHRDDKTLTDWNGLMIAALATASRAFDNHEYLTAAETAARWLLTVLRDGEGRLLHRYREGEAAIAATLDDYAFMIWGLIELYEASFKPQYLTDAIALQEICIGHFWDGEAGGFFFSADDAEDLIMRMKVSADGAYPSGNAVMFRNLLRLSRLTGDMAFDQRAAELADAFSGAVMQSPTTHAFFLCGLDFAQGPTKEVVVVGRRNASDTSRMIDALHAAFLPRTVVVCAYAGESEEIGRIAPYVRDLTMIDGSATAYVCSGFRCTMPTTSVEAMVGLIRQIESE
ncbi:MAG: thioredoxin domain-containing protein [Methanomicrobiaceae archaeon]|nr:thioredoxin domain-containing protein [Methanomicrobiaceae archaeon]